MLQRTTKTEQAAMQDTQAFNTIKRSTCIKLPLTDLYQVLNEQVQVPEVQVRVPVPQVQVQVPVPEVQVPLPEVQVQVPVPEVQVQVPVPEVQVQVPEVQVQVEVLKFNYKYLSRKYK